MTVEAVLLGSAQDGGCPQIGCTCINCAGSARDAFWRRMVTCLGLIDHDTGQTWLIDATPDMREQLQLLGTLSPRAHLEGIALTHAHIGHYIGLMHLGIEAWNTDRLPLYVSERMSRFLSDNQPWRQLVESKNVRLRTVVPGLEIPLGNNLGLVPVEIPHRDELSDTMAYVVVGPERELFYCPDIDSWDNWPVDLRAFVETMEVALLDGTFFHSDELPGRDMGRIPHPPVKDTVARLAGVDCDVRLVHLNHTNPLFRCGPERLWLEEQGFGVGSFGERWTL